MAGPDALIEQFGETVEHEWVTDYALDSNGQVDPDSLQTEREELQAVVSNPSEEDERRLGGRLSIGALQATVPSDRDVQADRGGRRDRFYVDGDAYTVAEVRHDTHPVTGTEKQTVLLNRLGGHE
jgi:hypothetical protein